MSNVTQETPSSPPLSKLLWECFSNLLTIKRRLHFLQAYSDSSDMVTQGKPFRIRNDIVYNMVLDVRDKCVIDLYSLTVAMRHGVRPLDSRAKSPDMRKKGLFFYISRDYSSCLSKIYERDASDDDDDFAIHTRSKAKRFGLVFPSCKSEAPSPHDVDQLCEDFRIKMRPLGQDRHKNRAHAHEGDMGDAKMHSFPELAELFNYTEDLLENLSLLSASTSYGRQNLNRACCKKTSEDTVDLVLFGHSDDITKLRADRTRKEFYDFLHELDAASDVDDQTLFNDRQFTLGLDSLRS